MTHVHPSIPLIIWGPCACYFFYRGIQKAEVTFVGVMAFSLLGLIVWTLTEYLLHRFMFHFSGKSKFSKRFVFLFHGLHHDDPDDPTRLVMPPVPALLFLIILYSLFSLIIPDLYMNVFFALFMVGYLIYDYIHYATHHFKMKSKIAKYLKRYHLKHHHAHEKSKYGVSSPLWDYVFRTVSGPKEES